MKKRLNAVLGVYIQLIFNYMTSHQNKNKIRKNPLMQGLYPNIYLHSPHDCQFYQTIQCAIQILGPEVISI